MIFSDKFVSRTSLVNSYENPVPAPLFRKSFQMKKGDNFELTICGLGIYELFINGKRVTMGYLSSYRSNPDHFLYYDNYDLSKYIKDGENVIGIILGNGFGNSVYKVWNFHNFPWKSAPRFALIAERNKEVLFDSTSFKSADSEILFDDFHSGEWIDARLIKKGWNNVGFDDSDWDGVIDAITPKGEKVLKTVEPILPYSVRKPIRILETSEGFTYDFGISSAGTYNLKIKGKSGQKIFVQCGDVLSEKDNSVFTRNLACLSDVRENSNQCDHYILSGKTDVFEPRFTYKGMRFAEIKGIDKKVAESVEIEFYEMSSSFKTVGSFHCDNSVINTLQDMVLRSNRSNFYYFPTDCPQREKNGWTGDAALSAEQLLLNFDCSKSLTEWLKNICKTQREKGDLPGIIPTGGWGYDWGNGPAWDNVLFEVPYRIYVYTGKTDAIEYCAPYMKKYLNYMWSRRKENGLLAYGLGDWCPIHEDTPLEVTDTATCKAICDNAIGCFEAIGDTESAELARKMSNEIKEAYKKELLDNNVKSKNRTQTDQAMAIYYKIVDEKDIKRAVFYLEEFIKCASNHIDFGVLGNRAFWRVLGENDKAELAVKLMTQDSFPSFKSMIDLGGTTLFEAFLPIDAPIDKWNLDVTGCDISINHHFWGDISAFFYRHLAGICINKPGRVDFKPQFISSISHLNASHTFESGTFSVEYTKSDLCVECKVNVPEKITAFAYAPNGYKLITDKKLSVGENTVIFVKNKR